MRNTAWPVVGHYYCKHARPTKRDLDNILKSLLDSLDHAGVFDDDEQIDELHVLRAGVEKPGNVAISLVEIEGNND